MSMKPAADNQAVEIACDEAPRVRIDGASYVHGSYRSFEFVDVCARAGQLAVLLSGEWACSRDLLLAVAGAVRPTSGSLTVGDASFAALAGARTMRAAMAWRAFQRKLRASGAVGLGVFTWLTEVDASFTVEEAVARELSHRHRSGAQAPDSLDFLAQLGLATHADQRIDRLHPAGRSRLSAALALAPAPDVATIDLRDPFCAGLTADEERAVVRDLRGIARATGAAVLVGCAEATSSADADAAFALDIAAAEALDAAPAVRSAL